MDVVLSVVGPGQAQAHGTSKYWTYTAVWNLLDYPALSFPASSHVEANGTTNTADSRKPGLPIGLQLIAKRWQDNKLLAALSVIEDVLRA